MTPRFREHDCARPGGVAKAATAL